MTSSHSSRRPLRTHRTVTWLGCALAAWAIACSSPTAEESTEGSGGSTGTTGGAVTTGGLTATGGLAPTGGTAPATGGSAGSGGLATTGGGGSGTGGAVPTGGAPSGGAPSGGVPTGGTPTGGVPTGGQATGGASTGGAPTGGTPTGGMPTGGMPTGGMPTGGVPTGGLATGGASTGGFATGGAPTGGVATGGEGGVSGMDTGGTTSGGAGTGGQSSGYCPVDEPCRIEPLGDSITEDIHYAGGYRVNLFRLANQAGKDITFVGTRASTSPNDVDGVPFPKNHEGTSGISIEGLKSNVVDAGLLSRADVDPHIILLHIGTNNMYGSHPAGPEVLLPQLLDAIIAECPDALLVVSTLIPLPMNTSGISAYNAAIPAIVEERAAAGAHIILVDQFTGFPTSELEDQVHPTVAGYARMGQVWFDAIEQYLP
ncbi:MAG TPA: GDSL-type esterase/lipase family protein [Polyangiaceae bacterium]|nr:GDSL-type esterase/lipase family protein [Polyangiaceae bacterium]